ncbi:MAG: hypothetical protein AB1584_19285 [Pseudomonadota bacterium]
MSSTLDQAGLSEKLMTPMNSILSKHAQTIQPLLGGSGTAARAALQNDEAVRKVATFCYPLLPGLLRLAVKEPVFVNFVMNNRERVLATLVGRE